MKFFKLLAIVFVSVLLLSASCRNVKAEKTSATEIEMDYTSAIVTTDGKDKGCEFLLKFDDKYFFPIGLTKEFQENGLEVEIDYTLSRMMQKECFNAQPIVLNKIRKKK